jgi:hypothetical protein
VELEELDRGEDPVFQEVGADPNVSLGDGGGDPLKVSSVRVDS